MSHLRYYVGMEKTCSRCKIPKSINAFNKNRSRSDGLQHYCKACRKDLESEWYQDNKALQRERNDIARNKLRSLIKEQKLGKKCFSCNIEDIRVLQFHHLPQFTKEFNIADAPAIGVGKKRLLEEMAKCILLCANCHILVTLDAGK